MDLGNNKHKRKCGTEGIIQKRLKEKMYAS